MIKLIAVRNFCYLRTRLNAATLLLLPLLATGTSTLAADAAKGKQTFQQCAGCHAINNDSNGFGPSLKGVVGRQAGSFPGYSYSAAMKKAGQEGLAWDEKALSEFLSSPKKKVPGTSMRFFGFWFQSQIDDVIAFLKSNP